MKTFCNPEISLTSERYLHNFSNQTCKSRGLCRKCESRLQILSVDFFFAFAITSFDSVLKYLVSLKSCDKELDSELFKLVFVIDKEGGKRTITLLVV